MTKSLSAFLSALAVCLCFGLPSSAAEIGQEDKVGLQISLMDYIDRHSVDGRFMHFDTGQRSMVAYYPANLHPMIVPVGDIYFLCADFRDETGSEVEVDFVAARDGEGFRVLQTMVNQRDIVREMMQAAN